jgi:hypothetical protein
MAVRPPAQLAGATAAVTVVSGDQTEVLPLVVEGGRWVVDLFGGVTDEP